MIGRLRATGRSDKCDWGHNCARYAIDVYELIHALGVHDVTLVGWSCGARLEIFEHSGHGLFYTKAEKFNQVVAAFVDDPAQ